MAESVYKIELEFGTVSVVGNVYDDGSAILAEVDTAEMRTDFIRKFDTSEGVDAIAWPDSIKTHVQAGLDHGRVLALRKAAQDVVRVLDGLTSASLTLSQWVTLRNAARRLDVLSQDGAK